MPNPGEYDDAKSVGVLYNSTGIYQWAEGPPPTACFFRLAPIPATHRLIN